MNANDKLNPPPQPQTADNAAPPTNEGTAAGEPSNAEVMKEGK